MNTSTRFAFLGLPLALGACSLSSSSSPPPGNDSGPHHSTEFTTDQLRPSMSAQSDGHNLTIFAAVMTHDGSLVKVDGTDWLTASLDGSPDLLLDWQSDDPPHYVVKALAPTDATDAVVTLHRANGETDAVHLQVPGAFDLAGDIPTDVQRDQRVTLHVTPAPDPDGVWFVYADGPCANYGDAPSSFVAKPSGDTLTFTAKLDDRVASGGSCTATMKVQHLTMGTADPTFAAGYPMDLLGVQERRFVVTFEP